MSALRCKITGTGSAYPETVLTNAELTERVDTSNEWIIERTGIRERRVVRPEEPSEFNSALAARAALDALQMAGKSPEDIDAIFYATCTPDTPLPSAACFLQQKIGATRAWAVDLNAACCGFLYAMNTADQYFRTGKIRTALVIGADILSSINNWSDRASCILFGDGAGAVLLEQTTDSDSSQVLDGVLGSDGTLWELLHIPVGGSNLALTPEREAASLGKIQMKGTEVFKHAVKKLAEYAEKTLAANNLTLDQIDWVIPHQANLRIIEAVARKLSFPMERVIVNIDRTGNNSSATIPGALNEAVRDGRIKKGQTVLMNVFGAGLTYAGLIIRF